MHNRRRNVRKGEIGRSLYHKSLHKMRQGNVQNYYESLVNVVSTKHGELCNEIFTRRDRRKANQRLRQIQENIKKGDDTDYQIFLSKDADQNLDSENGE